MFLMQLCSVRNKLLTVQKINNMEKQKWVSDSAHSELSFKVKHLMITNIKGEFTQFEATLLADKNDFNSAVVDVSINASSIFTNNAERDTHLKSADFLDVANHSQLLFNGAKLIKLDEQNYQLKGRLTIKGISKEVTFEVEFGGITKDPWGNRKAGFLLNGKINRKDWGINWNAALEAGGLLVSDEVKISAEVQFVTKD